MKKIISIVLVIASIISIMPLGNITAFAAKTQLPTIYNFNVDGFSKDTSINGVAYKQFKALREGKITVVELKDDAFSLDKYLDQIMNSGLPKVEKNIFYKFETDSYYVLVAAEAFLSNVEEDYTEINKELSYYASGKEDGTSKIGYIYNKCMTDKTTDMFHEFDCYKRRTRTIEISWLTFEVDLYSNDEILQLECKKTNSVKFEILANQAYYNKVPFFEKEYYPWSYKVTSAHKNYAPVNIGGYGLGITRSVTKGDASFTPSFEVGIMNNDGKSVYLQKCKYKGVGVSTADGSEYGRGIAKVLIGELKSFIISEGMKLVLDPSKISIVPSIFSFVKNSARVWIDLENPDSKEFGTVDDYEFLTNGEEKVSLGVFVSPRELKKEDDRFLIETVLTGSVVSKNNRILVKFFTLEDNIGQQYKTSTQNGSITNFWEDKLSGKYYKVDTGGEGATYSNYVKFSGLKHSNVQGKSVKIEGKVDNVNNQKVLSHGIYLKKDSKNFNGNDIKWSSNNAKTSSTISVAQTLKGLEPNTKYYYAIYANTAYGNYRSEAKSFKTPKVKPENTSIASVKTIDYRTNKEMNSSDLGIGDTVKVKWNAAKYAEYYTIKVNGVEDKTKIYGTEKILKLDTVGTNTISICAHNEVGSSAWTAEKIATAHEDVTLSFMIPDKEGNNNEYESHTLTWNHDLPSMPAAPSRIGSVFSGWYKDGEDVHANVKNVKEDATLYARYIINTYTVKFTDNKGNDIEVILPDGTKTTEQKVKHGEAAIPPAETDVPVPDGYRFLGWNADYSYINNPMTVKAVVDKANYSQPVRITSAQAMRYDGRYEVICTVNNETLEHTQGRIVVALKTDAGHLITTTESTVYFVEKNNKEDDITSEEIQKKVELKVLIPIDEIMDSKGLIADYVEIYAVENFRSTVPVAEHYTVRVQDFDDWSAWQTANPEGQEGVGEIESKTQYRYKELISTTVNTTTERNELVAQGWIFNGTTGPETVKGEWTKTKPAAIEYRTINEKTVTDYKEVTKYCYKRYTYKAGGATYFSYGQTWANNNGYYGDWEYKLTDKPMSKYKEFDGKMAYGNSNSFWWPADVNKKQGTDYTTATTKVKVASGSHKEYQAIDKIYTYHLGKWSDFSDWQDAYVEQKPDNTNQVETQKAYRYKTDLPKRSTTDTTNQRDDFCVGSLGSEYAGKQATLFIYKVAEASDWTTEHVAQTVIDTDGNYFFDPYILREEPTAITGDFTVTLGIEGAESAMYLGKIEAPDPEYIVTYYDGITGEKIPVSYEEVEPYNYCYKRYHYVIHAATGDYHLMYPDSTKDSGKPNTYGEWEYMITKEPLEYGGTLYGYPYYYDKVDGKQWYQADCNTTEGLKYTEYMIKTKVYNYEQTVFQHGNAVSPEPPIHEGYAFSHWDMRSTDIIGDTIINAIYDPIEYTVVYHDPMNEEETVKMETYAYNAEYVPPEAFDTAELKFIGWDKVLDGITTVKEDMVVTALYEPMSYEVTFNGIDDSGEAISIQEIEYGDSPVVPELEVPEEMIFFGWQAEGDESLTEVEMLSITENTQFYPQYMFVKTTETPVADLESGSYSSAQTVRLSCETDSAVIYYTTDGTDPMMSETALEYNDATGIKISDTCQLRFIATAFNMNVSQEVTALYAINDGDETDKFLLNLEVPEWGTTAYTGIVNSGMVLADGIPEYYGYTVAGAYLAYEFNEETEELTFSEPWDILSGAITEDKTIYLDYDANTYTVEFVDYDGVVISEETVLYLSSAVAPEVPAREGYVFTGWDTEDYVTVTENLTVNAVYVPEDEYVTINLNRSNYTMMSGNSYTLTAITGGNVEDPEIIWASSDENVAVVDDNGVVTATGKGSAEIYAIIVDNGETATCKINVIGNPSDELTLVGKSHLAVDDYGYIRGFTVSTDTETQEHYAETVSEVKTQFLNNELVFTDINGTILSDDDYVGTGTVIKVMDGGKELDSITVVVSGDMDGDGYVTNRDAVRVCRYLVDKEAPTEVQIAAMDVNGDGYVNNRDASMISRYLVGKETL